MQVKIKRIDNTLPLPSYLTKGAVAFDIYSRSDMEIPSHTIALIPTNLIIEVPKGYMLAVTPRSSTPKRHGLLIPHGIGIIDQDYNGSDDEILYQVYNFTESPVFITRGERVGQASFIRVDQVEWEEIDKITNKDRGGFGSTGK